MPLALVCLLAILSAPAEKAAALPRVLLIGDSISMGYAAQVKEVLNGKADVRHIAADGSATISGLVNIDSWLGHEKWDVIHFNWGLYDLMQVEPGKHYVPIEAYERNLERLVARMKKTGAVLIWATTTPVPEGDVSPPRNPTDVVAFNETAETVMKRNGVRIDDLYSAVAPELTELQRPGSVHFKPEGYKFLAGRVAEAVTDALRAR